MKLFRYPVLVFDNIIKQLEPIPLVSLSFCSRKTRERIKKVSFSIEYTLFTNESGRESGYSLTVYFPQQVLFVSFRQLPKNARKHFNNFKVRIGDTAYNLGCLKEKEEPNRDDIYLGLTRYKQASIFFNYILDLVRFGVKEIWINLNRLFDIRHFISEPCFKNVQCITLVGKKSTPAKKVTELFDCFDKPVRQTITKSYITSFSPTSKLLQSENLSLNSSRFISIQHLLNFTGKYIVLKFSSLSEEDIVKFVKHWLGGNYPNLEGAVIICPMRLQYEPAKVLNEFNTKRWNPAEREQNFIFKASFSGNEFRINDCSNGHDLERSDGLLATMRFEEDDGVFTFFVWHNRFP